MTVRRAIELLLEFLVTISERFENGDITTESLEQSLQNYQEVIDGINTLRSFPEVTEIQHDNINDMEQVIIQAMEHIREELDNRIRLASEVPSTARADLTEPVLGVPVNRNQNQDVFEALPTERIDEDEG